MKKMRQVREVREVRQVKLIRWQKQLKQNCLVVSNNWSTTKKTIRTIKLITKKLRSVRLAKRWNEKEKEKDNYRIYSRISREI